MRALRVVMTRAQYKDVIKARADGASPADLVRIVRILMREPTARYDFQPPWVVGEEDAQWVVVSRLMWKKRLAFRLRNSH